MKLNQENFQASLLDRLIDQKPKISRESIKERQYTLGQIKDSLIRDLEKLLNTKQNILLPPATFKEVNNSLYVYGLKDFTSENPASVAVRQKLRLNIEKTILLFEPRLRNVIVQLESLEKDEHILRFRIIALLIVEPLVEPITFDTYFDINRSEYKIKR